MGTDDEAAEPGCRIGVVIPSVNTVVEPFLVGAVPTGWSVHAGRVPVGPSATRDAVAAMDATGLEASRTLAACRPHFVAYCCTASSYVGGVDGDAQLRRRLEEATGVPCTTGAAAELAALRALGARSVCSLSPYPASLGADAVAFLEEGGVSVRAHRDLGVSDTFALAEVASEALVSAAYDLWDPAADALLVSCLNLRSHQVAATIEEAIGAPVVTATTAVLHAAITTLAPGTTVAGLGRLLQAPTAQDEAL